MVFCVSFDRFPKAWAISVILLMMSKTTGAKALPIWICAPSRADCMAAMPPLAESSISFDIDLARPSAVSNSLPNSPNSSVFLPKIGDKMAARLPNKSMASLYVTEPLMMAVKVSLTLTPSAANCETPSSVSFLPVPSMPLLASTPNRAVVSSRLKPNSLRWAQHCPLIPQTFRGPKHLPKAVP